MAIVGQSVAQQPAAAPIQLTEAQMAEVKRQEEAREAFQGIRRQWWGPELLEDAMVRIQAILAIAETVGAPAARYNFNPEDSALDWSSHGIAIVPKTQRKTGKDSEGKDLKGNEVVGLGVFRLPWLGAISEHPKGDTFIIDAVIGSMVNECATNLRREDAPSLPASVADFIESSRAAESMEAWNNFAPVAIKVLREQFGFKDIAKATLRRVLSATEYAKQLYPKVPQGQWEMLLDNMLASATAKTLEEGILRVWRDTRDSVEIAETEVDFGGVELEALFTADEDGGGNDGEPATTEGAAA